MRGCCDLQEEVLNAWEGNWCIGVNLWHILMESFWKIMVCMHIVQGCEVGLSFNGAIEDKSLKMSDLIRFKFELEYENFLWLYESG